MARVRNTNYQGGSAGSDFYLATDDLDPYSRELDVYGPALALDGHDHSAGKGLPVARLAAGLVNTTELANGAVTTPKLGTDVVTEANMAVDSVGADQIIAGSVGAAEIVDGGVGSDEIAADAVLLTHLAHGTADRVFSTSAAGVPSLLQVVANMIAAGAVSNSHLASGIDGAKLSAGTVLTAALAGSITEAKMLASTLTGNAGGSAIGTGVIHPNRLTNAGSNGAIPINDGSTSNWGKINYPSFDATNTPSDTQYLAWNNASAKFTWTTPGTGAVMTAVCAAVQTAAQIPSGWSRNTALDGRLMVFDGTVFGNTFTENNSYGSSWAHLHGGSGTHSHTAAALGVAGNTGGPSGTNTTGSTGNTSADGSHTHGVGSIDVNGTTDSSSPGNTDNASWQIPSRAYVPIVHS